MIHGRNPAAYFNAQLFTKNISDQNKEATCAILAESKLFGGFALRHHPHEQLLKVRFPSQTASLVGFFDILQSKRSHISDYLVHYLHNIYMYLYAVS